MKKIWVILSLVCVLAGCATSEVINPEKYDATKHARLRILDTGDSPSIHIVDCDSKEQYMRLSATGWFNKSNRIGMTQTAATDKAQQNGGKFREYVIPAGKAININPSSLSYTSTCDTKGRCVMTPKQLCEYPSRPSKGIIGKGLDAVSKGIDAVGNGFNSVKRSVLRTITNGLYSDDEEPKKRDDRASFIPQAGHQYEYSPQGCSVVIKDITEEEITNVPHSPYYNCPSEE